MLVTPGPGVVVLGLGLAVLAAEFAWARHWLHAIREQLRSAARNFARLAYGEDPAVQRDRSVEAEKPQTDR